MDEPVGNQPRSSSQEIVPSGAIPGNSHKSREAKPEPDKATKATKVVTGKVVMRKQPWYKRVGSSLIVNDSRTVGDHILMDVVIPAVKNLVRDIVVDGIDQTLFGGSRGRGRGSVIGGVSRVRDTRYDRMHEEPRGRVTRESRAVHDFGAIVLETRSEAIDVIDQMNIRIDRYKRATVTDLYDIVGETGSYADQKYGWEHVMMPPEHFVRQDRDGFLLDLPRPELLR